MSETQREEPSSQNDDHRGIPHFQYIKHVTFGPNSQGFVGTNITNIYGAETENGRILSLLGSKEFQIEQAPDSNFTQLNQTAQEVSQIKQEQLDSKKRKLIRWLSNTDPELNQKVSQKKHERETSKWFTEGEQYKQWREQPNSFLWLHGMPGSGKTILCSEIIEQTRSYCRDQPKRYLAYFYFSFRETKQRTDILLQSILSQIVEQGTVTMSVINLYDRYENTQPPIEQVLFALESMMKKEGEFFVIIDALDECPADNFERSERSELCEALKSIKDWNLSNLHCLVTSRKEVDLVHSLKPLLSAAPISIQGDVVKADIERVVQNALVTDRKLRRLPLEVQEDIKKALIEKASGMFRWVECQLDSLKKCFTVNDIRTALKSLPKTLDETYQRILMSIEEEHRPMVKRALLWLAYAEQPLSIEELAAAACIIPEEDVTPFDSAHQMIEPNWLVEILSNMVIVTSRKRIFKWIEVKGTQSVILAHFSVKEYLNSERLSISSASMFYITDLVAHQTILRGSLVCLTKYSSWREKSHSKSDLFACPILQYEAKFWPYHARAIQNSGITQADTQVLEFLESPDIVRDWLYIFQPDNVDKYVFEEPRNEMGSPLYYAAFFGFRNVLSAILGKDAGMINLAGGTYGSALRAACSGKDLKIVKILIEAGADVNIQGGLYGTALQAACCKGNLDLAKVLINAKANVNIQGGNFSTALQAACYIGSINVVKTLINAGANVNIQGGYYDTALKVACYMGHPDIVKILIDAGADMNLAKDEGSFRGSALDIARRYRHVDIVKFLLEAGAHDTETEEDEWEYESSEVEEYEEKDKDEWEYESSEVEEYEEEDEDE